MKRRVMLSAVALLTVWLAALEVALPGVHRLIFASDPSEQDCGLQFPLCTAIRLRTGIVLFV
jgi:hypothetical protein